jgi:type I restriction enzyme, S subunit
VEARFKEVETRSILSWDDIHINLVGASITRTVIYNLDTEASFNHAVGLVRMVDKQIKPFLDKFLKYLNSDMAVDLMFGPHVTTAQPNISLHDANGFPIPLPPSPNNTVSRPTAMH